MEPPVFTSGFYLHRLIVNNFKTYKGQHVIGPLFPFTALIGPNGSGKSNIMDAISFVMGVKDSYLRISKLSDLIYRSSTKEKDDQPDPTSMFVTAVFRSVNPDGSIPNPLVDEDGNRENIDLFARNPDEEHFTRTISIERSKIKKVFRINNQDRTEKDFRAELEGRLGIDSTIQNFLIFQGDVTSFAQKKPEEWTQWFEHISGSAELQKEYDNLQELCARNDQSTALAQTHRRSAAKEQKIYQEQKEESEHFQRQMDHRMELLKESTLFKLYHHEQDINEADMSLKTIKNTLRQEEVALEERDRKYNTQKQKEVEAHRLFTQKEQEVVKQERELRSARPNEQKENSNMLRMERNHEIAKERVENLEKEDKINKNAQNAIEADLSKLMLEKKEWEQKSQSIASIPALNAEMQTEYVRLKQELENMVQDQRAQLEAITPEQNRSEREIEELERKKENLERKIKQSTLMADSAKTKRVDDAEKRRTEIEQRYADIKQQIDESKEEVTNLQNSIEAINQRIQEVSSSIQDGNHEIIETRRETAFRKTVVDLQRNYPSSTGQNMGGVLGCLSELINVTDKKYSTAVTAAMGLQGKLMDAIVVETEVCAMKCLEYVSQQRSVNVITGSSHTEQFEERFVFLPLDTLRPKALDENLRIALDERQREAERVQSEQKTEKDRSVGFKLVYDLLTFKENIAPAVLYAVGSTVLFPTLDEAIKHVFAERNPLRVRAVTMDGDVISKKGLITAGSPALHRRAKKWTEKDVEKARKERDTLFSQKMHQMQQLKQAETRKWSRGEFEEDVEGGVIWGQMTLKSLEEDLISVRAEIAMLTETENRARSEADAHVREHKQLEKQISEMRREAHSRNEQARSIALAIEEQEEQVFKPFCEKLGIKSSTYFSSAISQHEKEMSQQRLQFESRQTTLQNDLRLLQARVSKDAMKKAKETLAKAEERMKEAKEKYEKTKKDLDLLQRKVDQATDEREAAAKQWKDCTEALSRLTAERNKILMNVQNSTREREKLEGIIHNLNVRRLMLLQQARLDEIDIPFRKVEVERKPRGKKTKQKANDKRARMRTDDSEDDVVEEVADVEESVLDFSQPFNMSYSQPPDSQVDLESPSPSQPSDSTELQLDFRGLSLRHRRMHGEEVKRELERFNSELKTVNSDLASMIPNLRASDQLVAVQKRLDELAKKFQDSQMQREADQKQFNQIKKERKARFMKVFGEVSSRIDSIYQSITNDASGAGSVVMSLTNRFEPYLGPIDIHVKPPSKSFTTIDALSGGEKTIFALAILFAVNSSRPAPFIVLDEIDAALDRSNVRNAIDFLVRRTRPQTDETHDVNWDSQSMAYSQMQPGFGEMEEDVINQHTDRAKDVAARQAKQEFIPAQQILAISLKGDFFDHADSVVGITRAPATDYSEVFTTQLVD
ncbi:putative Structural maintenance of chromosomes protein 1A [Blattamonas nauphoetae]|uniref:Structural maintenance of chromosomes protein n=1 Tax=Blattamonas nauphoetae TaxID=2049346 RepID=A0ABQ9XQ68_9EUKA|nr:putative Structural maintenance of chromosomes protein 1A [Blattamonas nauphoetae]